MLGKIVGDVLRFLFLYAEIYVPYACAFWIIFGGDNNQQIQLPWLILQMLTFPMK